MMKMKTKKEFVNEENNRHISHLIDDPSSSSRICRSTCCARACYRNCCHCSSCGNDDVSAQRHFRRDSDVCRARASSSCDDDRGVRSRRCLLSITTTTWLSKSIFTISFYRNCFLSFIFFFSFLFSFHFWFLFCVYFVFFCRPLFLHFLVITFIP